MTGTEQALTILLLSRGNIHNSTLLSTLVNEYSVDPKSFVVVLFGGDTKAQKDDLPAGVEEMSWNDALSLDDAAIKAVILQSLYPANARALREFAAQTAVSYAKVGIIITDNEVDLWKSHVDKFGSLDKGHTKTITDDMKHALAKIDNFCCTYNPFGQTLEEILARPLNISDTFPIRKLLPEPTDYAVFTGRVKDEIDYLERLANRRTIMVMSKPLPYERKRVYVRDLLRFCLFGQSRYSVTVLFWERRKPWKTWDKVEYRLIMIFVAWLSPVLRRFGRPDIRIRFLPSLSRHEYMTTLLRCYALIGQRRSGVGAMTEAVRNGGQLVLERGSYNEQLFSESWKTPIVYRNNNIFQELVDTENDEVDFERVMTESRDRFWLFYASIFTVKPSD
ncbi:hypothetical protein M3N55_10745 [Roseibaca sp. V10]|uniref:Uncharacterized protein n=1 Tax=Roseinatronobacter domitianus TaxID=2940293 RepID=A0ABT0M2X2_9RHOB|nr:hypothetical protein [Roseibaca domitiana]MCL1629211.1 hypothetical protein [Roseibaca domitiana]